MKTCTKCGVSQPKSNFPKNSRAADGHAWKCKRCDSLRLKAEYHSNPIRRQQRLDAAKKWKESHLERYKYIQRNVQLRRKYGITALEYDQLRKAQNGCCMLCGKVCGPTFQDMRVDHNHVTGKVRALLCPACNTGLGQFGDSVFMLEKAITYLKAYEV